MDGDAQLTREQILQEAEAIRAALQHSSSPLERQRLKLRYDELDALLRSGIIKESAIQRDLNQNKKTEPPNTRKCPFCAEIIKAEAIKCRFCGEFLDGRTKAAASDVSEQKPVMVAPPPTQMNTADFARTVAETARKMNEDKDRAAKKKKNDEQAAGCVGCLVIFLLIFFYVTWPNNDSSDYEDPNDDGSSSRNISRGSGLASLAGASETNTGDASAIRAVSLLIEENKLGVTERELLTMKNPRGEGTFVYVAQTEFYGVERTILWLVVDSKVFTLGSPSKMVTPSAPWPREADTSTWAKTGLDKFVNTDALNIVFGL